MTGHNNNATADGSTPKPRKTTGAKRSRHLHFTGTNPKTRPSPMEFGQTIRILRPGCSTNPGQLADWHRRIAVSWMPIMKLHGAAAVKYIQSAGL